MLSLIHICIGLSALGLDVNGRIGGSVQFFIYDVLKITVPVSYTHLSKLSVYSKEWLNTIDSRNSRAAVIQENVDKLGLPKGLI